MQLCAKRRIRALLVRRVHKRVRLYARAFCLYKKAGALAREAAPVVHAPEGNKLGRKLVRAFAYYHKAALLAHKRAAFAEFIQHPACKRCEREHVRIPKAAAHRFRQRALGFKRELLRHYIQHPLALFYKLRSYAP